MHELQTTSRNETTNSTAAAALFTEFLHDPASFDDDRTLQLASCLGDALNCRNAEAARRRDEVYHSGPVDPAQEAAYAAWAIEQLAAMAEGVIFLIYRDDGRGSHDIKAALAEQAYKSRFDPDATDTIQSILKEPAAFRAIIPLLGLPSQKLINAWTMGYTKSTAASSAITSDQYWELCLTRMLALEHQRPAPAGAPGICATLYRQNRLRNFGRCPEDMLLYAYDTRNDDADLWVYFLLATEDVGGSATRNSVPRLEEARQRILADNSNHKVAISIAEFGSQHDLKVLARQARLAGRLASFVVVDAHGLLGEVLAGYDDIDAEMVRDGLGAELATATKEQCAIFLGACSTAKDANGVSATLNQTIGRTVYGSSGGSYLRRVDVTFADDGTPQPDIDIGFVGSTSRAASPLRKFPANMRSADQPEPPYPATTSNPQPAPRRHLLSFLRPDHGRAQVPANPINYQR